MLASVIFGLLLLPCVGVLGLSLAYIWTLCYLAKHQVGNNAAGHGGEAAKAPQDMGLSAAQLEKLPRIRGEDLLLGSDCAVCLDDIESDQVARLLTGCNHAFHLQCADGWLSKHPVCPLCRSKLGPELLDPPEASPC